ncbi:MAG TPA: hypothetical protein DEF02_04550 [Clostridiales bacterium]|nr:hypothetical protein [Clostridiales bacterium]
MSPKRAKNAEKYCVFTILGYAKTTKNCRKTCKNKQKTHEKYLVFFANPNAFRDKNNLCANQK